VEVNSSVRALRVRCACAGYIGKSTCYVSCKQSAAYRIVEFAGVIDLDLAKSAQVGCKLRIHRITHNG